MTSNSDRLVNTDKLKAEIFSRVRISDVAERLDVDLFDSGTQQKGLCPLHDEDTPSFYVNDGKGVYHCFGCGEGGDAIDLIRKGEHLTYRDALVALADLADVDIEPYIRPMTEEEKEREHLLNWSVIWLTRLHPDDARTNPSTAEAMGVKKATRKPSDVPRALQGKEYLLKGVIFPYRLPNGTLVGWKARQPDKKMFQTPADFPLWKPTIFGIDTADLSDTLILVEGEYDCLVLRDHGIPNVVAVGGTKWTDEQGAMLADLHVKRAVFLFDGDEPGEAAALRIAQTYWDSQIPVHVAVCPSGSDPEDLVRAMGAEAVTARAAEARGALEYLLWHEWRQKPRGDMTAKLDFVRHVQQTYGRKLVGASMQVVLTEIAGWLEIPADDVLDFARLEKGQLQNVDSERVVLGKAIRDGGYFRQTRKRIVADDFFVTKHQRVWNVLEKMLMDGIEFDLPIARQHCEGEGVDPEYVELLAATSDLNIGWHEDQVVDLSVRRAAQGAADRFREVVTDASVPVNQLIGHLTHTVTTQALGRGSGAFTAVSEQVDQAMGVLHDRMKNPDEIIGLTFGEQFPLLNRNMQGLQPRRLVLVAATSGVGKSTITLQWIVQLGVGQAIPVDFISLEMDTDEILFKMSSHMTGIDSLKIMAGALTDDEARRVEIAMSRIRKSPLRIYAPDSINTDEFTLYCRESVMDRRTEVFVLDYAQMVGPGAAMKNASRYEHLGDFAYTAKRLARSLDVTMVSVAQLSRDAAKAEQPTPEHMGDSYELSRAADVILLIGEDEDRGMHELWVGKNRQGPGNQLIPVLYDKPLNTFREAGGLKEPVYLV